MIRAALAFTLLLSACDYSVDNSVRAVGGDAWCSMAGTGIAVCYSNKSRRGYVCFSSGRDPHSQAVCLEGLPSQPESAPQAQAESQK